MRQRTSGCGSDRNRGQATSRRPPQKEALSGGPGGSRTPKAFAAVLQSAATHLYSNWSLKRPDYNGLKTVCRATYSRERSLAYLLLVAEPFSLSSPT